MLGRGRGKQRCLTGSVGKLNVDKEVKIVAIWEAPSWDFVLQSSGS